MIAPVMGVGIGWLSHNIARALLLQHGFVTPLLKTPPGSLYAEIRGIVGAFCVGMLQNPPPTLQTLIGPDEPDLPSPPPSVLAL
uniref:Uncharacterized protein n=1 Tax=Tanacetum cinerariifolium TaxID=118510 RepID=A0A6L2J7C8_TANCI|nr:hypothetical protein [Tanacetum cinerariifolium]